MAQRRPPEPTTAAEYLERARRHTDAGREAEARADLDRVVALDPGCAEAWARRAGLAWHREEFDQVEADVGRALSFDPDLALAHCVRGLLLDSRGDPGALDAVETALRLDPGLWQAWNNRGAFDSDRGRPAESLPYLVEAIRLRPDHPLPWRNRGTARLELGRLDDARADLDRARDLAPRDPAIYFSRAQLHVARQDPPAALAELRQAL